MTKFRTARMIRFALFALAPLALSGCFRDDYWDRRDTVTMGAGDAVQVNQVTQTIDPWPPHAKNADINVDGQRIGVAVERYQQNKSIPPKGLNTTTVSGQAGPGAQATTSVQR